MKKVGKYGVRLLAIVVVLLLCGQLIMISGSRSNRLNHFAAGVQKSNTPTLLISGWGGGTPTYHRLITTYYQQKIAQKVMTIWVLPNGKCLVHGHLDANRPNQLIQLLYVWNYTPTYNPQTKQLTAALTMLHDRYHVDKLNVIAHSYGGSEWANAVFCSPRLQKEIKYQKVVLLGVPVDESFGAKTRFGLHLLHKSTDHNFKQLLRGASLMKANHNQPEIFSLLGSKEGKNDQTDGSVPHVQSQMMRLVVKKMGSTYHERTYANTTHFQLHQKKAILKEVAADIWDN